LYYHEYIMLLESTFPPDERVENEINILVSKGFNILLVCKAGDGKYQIEEKEGLSIYRIPISKFIYKSSAVALQLPFYFKFWEKRLIKIIKQSKIDIIHLHDLPLVEVGLRLSRKFDIPLVADYHENRPEIMKMYKFTQTFPGKYLISLKKWQEYQLQNTLKVDQLILVTEEAKDYYAKNYAVNPEKITVLPNYISLNRFKKFELPDDFLPELQGKFIVTYFGDTGLRRGLLSVVEAANLLKDNKKIHFIIIGTSKEQPVIEKKIKQLNLENITLTGWIPISEAVKYINISKVGLCPFLRNIHHDTTYANKMFQFLMLGKPVIVSNCTAQQNFVLKESCGLVFEAGNSMELSNRIISLMDELEYERLSKNGKACTYQKYNWETSGSEWTSIYTKLAKIF
jgi:glycosyltransferase involved in cell wall biosynthesis